MSNVRGMKFIVRPPARDYLVYGLGKIDLSPEEFFVAVKPILSVLLSEGQHVCEGQTFEHPTMKRAALMAGIEKIAREMAGERKPKPIFNKLTPGGE